MIEDEPISAADAAMYRLIVENAADLIVRGDAARRRNYVSPSVREVLGYEPEELLGKHAYQLVHPDDLARVQDTFGKISSAHPNLSLVFRMRRTDGRYIWVEGRYRHLPADDGVLAVLRDITAQKNAEDALALANLQLEAANQALQRHAHQDGLTGLANRRRFDELLETEFRRARRQHSPLGLVMLDVDCFKAYNDCYGHIAGDVCLRRIGQAIEGTIRRPGDFAARYGGEEIVVLLPATDATGATVMAERMRDAVASLGITHLHSPCGVATVSAGAAAMRPADSSDEPVALVSIADRALYQAKADGRNRVRTGAPGTDAPAIAAQ